MPTIKKMAAIWVFWPKKKRMWWRSWVTFESMKKINLSDRYQRILNDPQNTQSEWCHNTLLCARTEVQKGTMLANKERRRHSLVGVHKFLCLCGERHINWKLLIMAVTEEPVHSEYPHN